jgi:hypothetical protein
VQDLDHDGTLGVGVVGEIDRRRASASQLPEQAIPRRQNRGQCIEFLARNRSPIGDACARSCADSLVGETPGPQMEEMAYPQMTYPQMTQMTQMTRILADNPSPYRRI